MLYIISYRLSPTNPKSPDNWHMWKVTNENSVLELESHESSGSRGSIVNQIRPSGISMVSVSDAKQSHEQ